MGSNVGGLFVLVALVWAAPVSAAEPAKHPVHLSETTGEADLAGHIDHLTVDDPNLTIEQVAERRFEPISGVPNFGFVDGVHWFRVTLINDTGAEQTRLLEMSYPPIDELTLFVPHPDGGYRASTAGDRVNFSEREIQHRHPLFELEIPAGATYVIYLRTSGQSSLQLPLKLWDHTAFIGHDNVRQLAVGAYYGVLLAMIVYHLFLFFTVRERTYLWFVAFVASYGWISIQLDGVASQLLWGELPIVNAGFPLSMAAAIFFAARYSRDMLELRAHTPRWCRAVVVFEGLAIAIAAASLFLPYAVSMPISMVMAGGLMATLIPASALAWRRGARQARYYLLAWGAFFIGTAMMILNKLGAIPVTRLTDSVQQVGVVVEVFLFSLALADRINTIKAERADAQQSALDAQREAAANLQAEVDRQTRELREQAEQLREVDQQKTRFFQNVSHELRTPLTLILTPLEQMTAVTNDRRLHLATKNARRLLKLVNQLLEFQKLAAGKRELDLAPVDMVRIARSCGDFIAPTCQQRGISYNLRVDAPVDETVTAEAEVDALEKILFNYLSNALKFTPDHGAIEIAVRAAGDRVRVSVADSGPGIPAEQQEELFQEFSQLDNQDAAGGAGTGLGLAFARSLAEAMGGTVGVDSQPGAGSTFWLDLPRTRADSIPDDALTTEAGGPTHHPEIELTTLDGVSLDDLMNGQTTPSDIRNRAASLATVLVVDDLADMRTLLRDTLHSHGYAVRTATSGFDGLRSAQADPPDLIVTDWMMPGMTGPELIRSIRAQSDLAGVPIVLLTARSDAESKMIGTEIGADAFLGKPFNEPELLSTIGNLLRLKDSERQVRDLNRHLAENVLKRYLPSSVVDKILAGEASIDGPPEKYTATVLFGDLVGFTEMTRTLRVAKMSRLLNDYLGEMCEAVFLNDGTVDKFIGDAVMAVFGAPIRADPRDQVARAIATAEQMREALRELSRQWERDGVGPLEMRIGIHQGPIVMGNFGNERRADFTAVGPTVNMAARLQSSCPPGEILVSGEVYDYLPENAAEPAGEFELRGIGSVLLYRLVTAPRPTLRDMRPLEDPPR